MMTNPDNLPVEEILRQMTEKRPLPMGVQEFEVWSDRIISGAMLPATHESQKFALAEMIMHMGPGDDHECDGHFIKRLRMGAIKQIAHARMMEIRDTAKARLAATELAEAQAKGTEAPANENIN